MASKGYYAVRKGRIPGLYDSVKEFEKQIFKYPNAEYRKFNTREEAEQYLIGTKVEIGANGGKENSGNGNSADLIKQGRKISLPDHWENYFTCILLHMLLPLLPIIIEFIINKSVKQESLTLTASMYAITIGISSKSKSQFGLAVVVSLIFAICYGADIHRASSHESWANGGSNSVKEVESIINLRTFALCAIGLTFLFHVIERYNRHIVDRASFFNFK